MENIRTSMKTEAESLKSLVDGVTSEKLEHTHTIEKSFLEMLKSQETAYDDYIAYLEKLTKEFQKYLSLTNQKIFLSKALEIQTIPETSKPIRPVFTAGQFNKDDLTKLLGRICVPNTEPEKRITKPMKVDSTRSEKQLEQEHMSLTNQNRLLSKTSKFQTIPETTKTLPPGNTAGQFKRNYVAEQPGRISVPNTEPEKPMETVSTRTEKQLEQTTEKQILSLSSDITKVREYKIPNVYNPYHVSVGKSGSLWVSDWLGNLVQLDLQGNLLQSVQTSGGAWGYHTVTQEGDLIFSDRDKRVICRIMPDKNITEFTKTEDWEPLNMYSSRIHGDILVGMTTKTCAKVTRYDKAGKEIQSIQRDNKGRKLYSYPRYITENINGDICTSDLNKQAVVVVNKAGQHRFSYIAQGPWFRPNGICTDVLGHILVCDNVSDSVHLLNQDGGFLSILLSRQEGLKFPRGLCVDDENNIYVEQLRINTVSVYKYLQ